MAKQDFIPRADTEFLAWHDNFTTQAVALGLSLGLLVSETNVVIAVNTSLHEKLNAARDR